MCLYFFDSTTFKSLGQKKEHFFRFLEEFKARKNSFGDFTTFNNLFFLNFLYGLFYINN